MRIRTLLQLTAREYGLLLAALPFVVAVRIALWMAPSRLTLRFLRRMGVAEGRSRPTTWAMTSSITWAVQSVSKFVPRATCLTQAIAAKLLLRRFDQDARLCLGVTHASDGTLRAHAWLEQDGRPVLGGSGIRSMMRLPELPDRDQYLRPSHIDRQNL